MNTLPAQKNPMAPFLWAQAEIGVHEIPGVDNAARIVWYHSFTTLKATDDETPWCSAFMCAAAESNGFPSTRSAAASSWARYGDLGTGAVGDIAVFNRPGGHHVAFINSLYVPGDRTISCLGGNQGDAVCVKNFLADHLIAIRRFAV